MRRRREGATQHGQLDPIDERWRNVRVDEQHEHKHDEQWKLRDHHGQRDFRHHFERYGRRDVIELWWFFDDRRDRRDHGGNDRFDGAVRGF
jgi:hypothetical protein